jgi:hypothetical protein
MTSEQMRRVSKHVQSALRFFVASDHAMSCLDDRRDSIAAIVCASCMSRSGRDRMKHVSSCLMNGDVLCREWLGVRPG